MNINEILNTCLSNMRASEDFNDVATVSSIKDLLSCIIENPAILINCANEEKLSIAILGFLQKNSLYGIQETVAVQIIGQQVTALGPFVPGVDGDQRSGQLMRVHIILCQPQRLLPRHRDLPQGLLCSRIPAKLFAHRRC